MNIINLNSKDIIKNPEINTKFITINHNKLKINCKIFKGNFYLDSFNYFPITEKYNSFKHMFSWGDKYKYNNFYSDLFYKNFIKNKENFNIHSDVFILGSSSVDNYYSNMITFLPRIFFHNGNQIKLAIHRNSSNKFRSFILKLCRKLKKNIQIVFLDENFYYFKDSFIPQFFNLRESVKILNNLFSTNSRKKLKIYLSRQKASYRNLVNEVDVVEKLKKNGFKIIDLNNLEIYEQIKIFSNADIVISASGSSLANIVFCQKETKIIEIAPIYKYDYEVVFRDRYKEICNHLDLQFTSIEADPVELEKIDKKITKLISPKILNESNYYKNLLLQLNKLDNLIKGLTH